LTPPSSVVYGNGHGEGTRRSPRTGSRRDTLGNAGDAIGLSSVKHVTTRDSLASSGCTAPVAPPSNDTSRSKAKRTRTTLPTRPTSRNAKQITCRTRFGVRVLFAFSGMNNADSALYAALKSLGTRGGALTTAFHVYWVVRKVPRIAFYFTQSATTGFITSVFPSRSRVSFKEAFAGPELCDWKLSCTVLRGLDSSNGVRLLGKLSGTVLRGLDGAIPSGYSVIRPRILGSIRRLFRIDGSASFVVLLIPA
jgi:hypothetical protein